MVPVQVLVALCCVVALADSAAVKSVSAPCECEDDPFWKETCISDFYVFCKTGSVDDICKKTCGLCTEECDRCKSTSTCNGRGTFNSDTCTCDCDNGYIGDECQTPCECEDDPRLRAQCEANSVALCQYPNVKHFCKKTCGLCTSPDGTCLN